MHLPMTLSDICEDLGTADGPRKSLCGRDYRNFTEMKKSKLPRKTLL